MELDSDREPRRGPGPDAARCLDGEARPSARGRRPTRRRGGWSDGEKELRRQIPVSAMDLHTVETRGLTDRRGGPESFDDVGDLCRCQFTRRRCTGDFQRDRAGGNRRVSECERI